MAKSTKTTYTRLVIPSFIKGEKYYLYTHTRADKSEPFYFGVGTLDKNGYSRAIDKSKRNPIWKKITNKTEYTVLIIAESDNREDMLKKEIEYINLMGKKCNKSGCLSNITDGGDGGKGYKVIWTEQMKDKIRQANKKRIISETTRHKLRIALKKRGIINKLHGKEESTFN